MRNNRAQEAVEFIIIVVLVFFAAFLVVTLFGNKVAQFFKSDSSVAKSSKSVPNLINPANDPKYSSDSTSGTTSGGAGGSLGGTPQNPVKQCSAGVCSIDYGEFLLSNIPENINSYLQSTGSSGTTSAVMDIMMQIADQLAAEGKQAESDDIRKLANLGHMISDIEEQYEAKAKLCSNSSNQGLCLAAAFNAGGNDTNIPLNPDLVDVLPNYSPDFNLLASVEINRIDNGRNFKTSDPSLYESNKTSSPAIAYIDLLDKILANSNNSDAVKGVVSELTRSLNSINTNLLLACGTSSYYGKQMDAQIYYYKFDPITGTKSNSEYYPISQEADILLHPQTSSVVDLDSALICASGSNQDINNQCVKK